MNKKLKEILNNQGDVIADLRSETNELRRDLEILLNYLDLEIGEFKRVNECYVERRIQKINKRNK